MAVSRRLAISMQPTRQRRLNVAGLVITPGFIDVHSHADEDMLLSEFRAAPAMIRQGVTTAVFGIDGGYSLGEFRELRRRLQRDGTGVNYLFFIGHNGIRKDVMGMANRAPTDGEMQRMREQVRLAMQEGAVGLSSGLMYLPGQFASTQEVIDLTREVAPFGGLYDSHDRDPVFNLLASVEECLETGRRAGVETHVAHLKAVGLRNAGRTPQLIKMIEAARARGEVVTADVYPYDGATARLVAEVLVPPQDSAARETSSDGRRRQHRRFRSRRGTAEAGRRVALGATRSGAARDDQTVDGRSRARPVLLGSGSRLRRFSHRQQSAARARRPHDRRSRARAIQSPLSTC